MKIINRKTLNGLSEEAAASSRLRRNLNLHEDSADPCQRLFNALEPGTYIRPHRHLNPPKIECLLAVRGRMALIVFSEDGQIDHVVAFGDDDEVVAIELPPGTWHSVVSLERGSIFFETSAGPYVALTDKDFAPWAPEAGSPEATACMARWIDMVQDD